MKAGWEVRPLGEVCDVLDRLRKPITKKDRVRGPYPYYGATGELDRVEDYLFDEPLVLIGEDGAKWGAGDHSAFAVSGKVWVNNHAHVIRPDRTALSDEWLIYYLNCSDLSEFITGMTVPKLNQARMRDILIPIPPLEEQKQIVAVLDTAFEGLTRAKENAEANLQNARELFKSVHASKVAVDGPRVSFDEIVSETQLGLVRSKKEQASNLPIPYLRMNSIGNEGEITNAELVRVNCSDDEVSRYALNTGDFLFNTRNSFELVGKACVVRQPFLEPTVFNNNILRARFLPHVSADYVNYYFMSDDMQFQIEKLKSGTTSVVAVYYKGLKDVKLALPDLETQQSVVVELDAVRREVESIEKKYRTKLTHISDLRQSLLQKAFAGELT